MANPSPTKGSKGRPQPEGHSMALEGFTLPCICGKEQAKPGELGKRCQARWDATFPPRKPRTR